MTVIFNRDEVLNLMQELPVNHWLQDRLLQELVQFNTEVNVPVVENAPKVEAVTRGENETVVLFHNKTVAPGKCGWECYGVLCREDALEDNQFCNYHYNAVCWCGNKATHGCDVELQFVCGGPLCNEHKACARH